jgi:branched-chain amino acid transport system substrate-binding protein
MLKGLLITATGIVQGGQKLAGPLVFVSDVHALGLPIAHGLNLTTAFSQSHDGVLLGPGRGHPCFSKRYAAAYGGKTPTMDQAGVYGTCFTTSRRSTR